MVVVDDGGYRTTPKLQEGRITTDLPKLGGAEGRRAAEVVQVPFAVVSAVEEVPPGVEGYDHDVEGSPVKDDMKVFGRGVWSAFSCICDSVARTIH